MASPEPPLTAAQLREMAHALAIELTDGELAELLPEVGRLLAAARRLRAVVADADEPARPEGW